jgi:branched-chain amino acid transport system ATP-binding protein
VSGALLEINALSAGYGRIEVVTDVSLTVTGGSIVTIIGTNGAGKTTLLNAIMGILPSRGTIRFGGEMVPPLIEGRIARGLCLVPERRELFGTMSVQDNLALGGFLLSAADRRAALAEVYNRFPRLNERRRQAAVTLSGGERQMLALGRALMSRPRLLLLDEPSLGLAPRIVQDIFRIITDLRASGASILLVEQNARAALEVADEAHVMELGQIVKSGPAKALATDPVIVDSYLGLGAT